MHFRWLASLQLSSVLSSPNSCYAQAARREHAYSLDRHNLLVIHIKSMQDFPMELVKRTNIIILCAHLTLEHHLSSQLSLSPSWAGHCRPN